MTTKTAPIRVLIADDSAVCRELLVSILQNTPKLQVVGTAHNGEEAVRLTQRLKPDVIAMDFNMPKMNGLEATKEIMAVSPRPIVMLSSAINVSNRDVAFNALKAGALTLVQKPVINDPEELHEELINQLILMSEVKVVRRWISKQPASNKPVIRPIPKNDGPVNMVAIAASTGGPSALAKVLKELPADFPTPILVVQHITTGFSESLVKWLNGQIGLEVQVARHADEPRPGVVYLPPDHHHLTINEQGLIALHKIRMAKELCPSADMLFHSVARAYGASAVGVILTGMGSDGAAGLKAMYEKSAYTIAQDEASSVVFGMPAVAIAQGAVSHVHPIEKIAQDILAQVSNQRASTN